jgi:uncharacterized protein YabE (DUF348 family)
MITLETFTNEVLGIETTVSSILDKFHVRLKDTDCDEYLPTTLIFTDYQIAIDKAKEIVDIDFKEIDL